MHFRNQIYEGEIKIVPPRDNNLNKGPAENLIKTLALNESRNQDLYTQIEFLKRAYVLLPVFNYISKTNDNEKDNNNGISKLV